MRASAALGVLGELPQPVSGLRAIALCSTAITFYAVKVPMREAVGQAAQAFLIRHNSLGAACVGELVHSLDHPALVAEAVGGQLLDMLAYAPGCDW